MSSRRGDRQRKRDDAGDGMSTAGKVALGVAAAAAGAAVGYIGSQLLSAWLNEPAEEKPDKEKPEKPKKYDPDESKSDKPTPPSKDDRVNDKDAQRLAAVNGGIPATVPQMSLHEQLLHYYHEYVDIPGDRMQVVQALIGQLTLALRHELRQSNSVKGLGLKVGDLVTFGSVAEGHQVIRPDSVDVMIPVMFGSQCRAQEAGDKLPGSFVIVVDDDSAATEVLCDEERRLVTSKLLDILRAVVERVAEAMNEYQCTVEPVTAHDAMAVSLAVYGAGHDQVTVKFVPFVIIDGHLFLPAHSAEQPDIVGRLWRESFVRQEKWSIDRFDASVCGHVVVLKVLKAIRLNHREQFGAVSSYHLKIALFHVLEDLPDSGDWQQNAVGERLIDLLMKLTEVLSERCLPHYFEHNVNLLQEVPPETCNNLAKFIERKLAHNDIACLLKRDY